MIKALAYLILITLSNYGYSNIPNNSASIKFNQTLEELSGNHGFHGLAAYYNHVQYFAVNSNGYSEIQPETPHQFDRTETFVALGRFQGFAFPFPNTGSVQIAHNQASFSFDDKTSDAIEVELASKTELEIAYPQLGRIRYRNLWAPFAILAELVEWLIVEIQDVTGFGWGLTIITLAAVLKLLLMPLGVLTVSVQRSTSEIKSRLEPMIYQIKKDFSGEEAHDRIMSAHKELGVSPFYSLKPLFLPLIQLPVLIAVFNALGELPQLRASSFLWISDLSAPDKIANIGMAIPLIGDRLSALPFIMTGVTILAALLHTNRYASKSDLRKQRLNLYFMAGAFFLLFYPFPSSMVLYWSTSNVFHIFQQRLIKI